MPDWLVFSPQGGPAGAMMPNIVFLAALAVAIWLRWVAVRTGFPVYCFVVCLAVGIACALAASAPAGPAVFLASLVLCAGMVRRYGLPWRRLAP